MNKKQFFLIARSVSIILFLLNLSACVPKVSNTKMMYPLNRDQSYKGVLFDIQGSPEVTSNKNFQPSVDAIRELFQQKLSEHSELGLTTTDNPKIVVKVLVNQFRFVSAGARIGTGVAAGEAIMGGVIAIVDAGNQKQLGEYEFIEKSGTSQGIMSDKTSNQEAILVDKLITILKNLKG